MSETPGHDFEQAARAKPPGVLRELLQLVRQHKKWWLIPILIVLILLGVLVALSSTAAAPFIYTLF